MKTFTSLQIDNLEHFDCESVIYLNYSYIYFIFYQPEMNVF